MMFKYYKRFYLFMLNAKCYMGIYFAGVVFVVGLVVFLSGGDSLSLLSLLQMLLVCLVLGLLEEGLLGERADYAHGLFFGRSVLFLILATLLCGGSAWLFGWFGGLASWCVPLFSAFMLAGFIAMLAGEKWEQERDSQMLDRSLREWKNQ